jgi:hypothetical protein
LTLDSYEALFTVSVGPEATPVPVLGCYHKTAFYRIAVYIPHLLDPLLRAANIEILEPLLPDRSGADSAARKQFRETLFDDFHHDRRIAHLRLGHQEMEMLGHHHVPDHDEAILLPSPLQHPQE